MILMDKDIAEAIVLLDEWTSTAPQLTDAMRGLAAGAAGTGIPLPKDPERKWLYEMLNARVCARISRLK